MIQLLAQVVFCRVRRMRVVVGVTRSELASGSVRMGMRMGVRVRVMVRVVVVMVRDQPGDRICVPVSVILTGEMERNEQRLQHEAHADDDSEEPLHRAGSRSVLHLRRRGRRFAALTASAAARTFVEPEPTGKRNRLPAVRGSSTAWSPRPGRLSAVRRHARR
ncbi:MAG: hypothetical protein IPM29_03885 [Planctomycetes bacterium]|nr:hypothetical protein [Planctomycetota bacterium]